MMSKIIRSIHCASVINSFSDHKDITSQRIHYTFLAGFAADAYFLRVEPKAKQVPIYGLALCALFTIADMALCTRC